MRRRNDGRADRASIAEMLMVCSQWGSHVRSAITAIVWHNSYDSGLFFGDAMALASFTKGGKEPLGETGVPSQATSPDQLRLRQIRRGAGLRRCRYVDITRQDSQCCQAFESQTVLLHLQGANIVGATPSCGCALQYKLDEGGISGVAYFAGL